MLVGWLAYIEESVEFKTSSSFFHRSEVEEDVLFDWIMTASLNLHNTAAGRSDLVLKNRRKKELAHWVAWLDDTACVV